ncbi:hypothetical protein [Pseudoduganella umbonata]|uniref:Uncharacterized protein n=1 Tax=Pseudoduganella umbonata TaxID=864828 RepID=A0A4P8HUT4_9BURK|nr:hypothetical protein [Pseudoduganella umbonata]MBB3223322.1 hypothetical protein [Pseudoduganella umbonata]QCP13769.1 hypothetical protein FCL38_27555 [Pseudoduganella umbonata]
MSREKDQLTNTEDAGYFTASGNHAAGEPANDTTQVNRAPNINPEASKQSSVAGSSGGMDMTQQSIGGQGAQDGISGTPSGTQGGQSGQGINQGGQNQQSSQGQSDYLGGSPAGQDGIRNDPRTQPDPQAPNRDSYGGQQTGATSGEVGDGRSPHQVATSGVQSTQHSAGGSLQADAERAGRQDYGSVQETTSPGGTGTLAEHLQSGPGNKRADANQHGGSGNSGMSQMKGQQQQQQQPPQGGESVGEVGESGLKGNQQSDNQGVGSGRTAGAGARQSDGDDGSAPGAGTAQRGFGGSESLGGQQSSSPGGSGTMANKQGGPGNQQAEQSGNNQGGPGQNGLSQMKEQQRQGGPGSGQSQQMEQSAGKPHAGTGGGHGGQHSGGMGGERGGDLHNVGAQSGETGRGGLGGNNVEMQGSSKGNQQSGENLIGQTTLGSGGSQSADRDSLDALPADAMGGERVGMGSRGHSQQSDKSGNAQADTWKNQARPNNRSDNEQADHQLGMQGSPGEPGHDIDDLGSKQSGSSGSRGGSEDQR